MDHQCTDTPQLHYIETAGDRHRDSVWDTADLSAIGSGILRGRTYCNFVPANLSFHQNSMGRQLRGRLRIRQDGNTQLYDEKTGPEKPYHQYVGSCVGIVFGKACRSGYRDIGTCLLYTSDAADE